MRVLIVHLSDIHIRGADDPVLSRVQEIGAAASSRAADASHVLLAVSGDIAFSGAPAEYKHAVRFLAGVSECFDVPCTVVVAPGNHDCDFSAPSAVRDALVEAVRRDETLAEQDDLVSSCLATQDGFFAFRDLLVPAPRAGLDGRLWYEYHVSVDEELLVARCYNTAWLSRRHEQPASLVFAGAPAKPTEADLVVSVFHHPYGWLTQASARKMRRSIETTSHVVLTGHEHEHERRAVFRAGLGTSTTYIEASALQADGTDSSFGAVLIDTRERGARFYEFRWDGTRYAPLHTDEAWSPIALRERPNADGFQLTARLRDWLADPGFSAVDSGGAKRTFSELYLYPDLIDSIGVSLLGQERHVVRSASVFETLAGYQRLLIGGPRQGGRTAFAKRLYLDYLERGFVPLYIDAADPNLVGIRPRGGDVPRGVFRQLEEQYGSGMEEAYRQLQPSKRVIIIDNLTEARIKAEDALRLLEVLAAFAGHVIAFGDNTLGEMGKFAPWLAPHAESRSLDIRPFNHGLRERFAQRWFGASADPAQRSQRLDEAERILDTIVGRNYVPAFPVYVIAVLQACEEGSDVDMRGSTHGYFYEILIRAALAKGGTKEEFDVRLNFLMHVAFEMFSASRRHLLSDELRASFDRYQDQHDVGGLEFTSLIGALKERNMLVEDADRTSFRYPYLYFYFVASYLSRNMDDASVRARVENLCDDLSQSDASDILLFMAHLSSHDFVVRRLLAAVSGFYRGTEPATLEAPVAGAVIADEELAYDDRPNDEVRRERADERDSREQTDAGEAESAREDDRTFASAVRAIKILGQVLKNFPGSMRADMKLAIAEACFRLGRRCMAVALDAIDGAQEEITADYLRVLREASPGLPEERLKPRAERFTWFLRVLITLGLTRAIARYVGARQLEPTYRKLLAREQNPATRLVDLSLKLEINGPFPGGQIEDMADEFAGSPLPLTVLKFLVVERFRQISVDPTQRQRTCAKLGIKYRALPPARR